MAAKDKDAWKVIQQRTFTNWFNDRLRGNLKVARKQVEDLQADLKDGILLIELLNILAAPKKIVRYNKMVKNKVQCMENLGAALKFLTVDEEVKLVNIGPEDIYDGNLKLILGLVWTLIRTYQIKSKGRGLSTKQAMLLWINQQIPEYGIKNFTVDWNDGRAVCGLGNSIKPGLCSGHWTLDRSTWLANCELGMQLALEAFNIPRVLSAEDMASPDVDELSVMTYLSYYCEPGNSKLLEWIRSKIPHRDIQNLCSDWNSGANLGALMEACFPDSCPEWVNMVPEKAEENLRLMMDKIEKKLSIVSPLKPKEMADPKVDEILVACYLAQFRNAQLKLSPEGFTVFPPQLPSGVARVHIPVKFVIDTKGQPPPDGAIQVTAKGPSTEVVASIAPGEYGDYNVSFVPAEVGDFEVSTRLEGDQINGSPFTVVVTDPSKCRIVGDLPEQMQVGVTKEVVIETAGAGNGTLDCVVEIEEEDEPGQMVQSEATKTGDDKWKLFLTPMQVGEGTVHFTWSGEDIPRTPFDTAIFDASKVRPSKLPEEARVGETVEFYLLANGAGLCLPKVVISGPTSQCRCGTKERANGRWDLSFTPWEVGHHAIAISWGEQEINGSPLALDVVAVADASGCTASGPGLEQCIATVPAEFFVSAQDDLLETQALVVRVSGSEGNGKVGIKELATGKYEVTYVCQMPGMYKVEVRVRDKNIPSSPFNIQCLPAPNAANCRAYGQCLHPNAILLAGSSVELCVDTTRAGTGEMNVVAKGKGGLTPKIYISEDDAGGTYSIKFTPPRSGKYYIHVWWCGIHIPKSPFQLRIHDGPNAAKVRVYGPGIGSEVEVGHPAKFTIETKDAGIGTLLIRVHGVKDAFDVEAKPVAPDKPRTLSAQYNPAEGGNYRVAVQWSGVEVPLSPFNVLVRDPEQEERQKKKEFKQHYSSETHTGATKTASLPGHYANPGAMMPVNQSTPGGQGMMAAAGTTQTMQKTTTKVSFKEEKQLKKKSSTSKM